MSEEVVEQTEKLNIYQRQVQAMLAVSSIPKNGYNSFGKYKYATDADVLDTMRLLLAKHGIGWVVSMTGHEWNEAKNRTIATLEISLVNVDNPKDCITVSWFGEANDKTDKGVVKAITSGVKYFLLKSFLASAGNEGDDADSGPRPAPELSTLAQKNEIKKLMETLGYTNVDAALTERRYPKLMLLTKGQAKSVIEKLEKSVEDKKGKEE